MYKVQLCGEGESQVSLTVPYSLIPSPIYAILQKNVKPGKTPQIIMSLTQASNKNNNKQSLN